MTKVSYTNNLQPTGNRKAIQKQKKFFINEKERKKILRVG